MSTCRQTPRKPMHFQELNSLRNLFLVWLKQWGEGLEVYPAYGVVDKLLGQFWGKHLRISCGWKVLHMIFVEVLICWNQSQKF